MLVRPDAYLRREHPKGTPLGYVLALLESVRLGWEGLLGTNTLTREALLRGKDQYC